MEDKFTGYVVENKLIYSHSGTLEEMIKWFEEQREKDGIEEFRMWREP